MQDWENCQKSLGVVFDNQSLLRQALTHSSYVNEHPDAPLPSNERLEFLGDAVLNFTVAEKLYKEFSDLPEGKLTAIRASLVCRDALVKVASSLKLGDYLLLGQGEEASGGRMKPSNLENAMEAVIGAIYLDQGLPKVKRFILNKLEPRLRKIKTKGIAPNYKALLQEFTQEKRKSTPVYQLLEATGPAHARRFTVAVTVEGEVLGEGTGKNKKTAETEAARSAWEKIEGKEDAHPTPNN
ncbi:MAG: ribonuclease III [Chloroflexota bacterium]|nr:ribonuclease III [Chloroflexota bacterium]